MIQAAYLEAKNINGLTIADVATITGVSNKTAESHLYEKNRQPGWREVYLMVYALRVAGMRIPRELRRFVSPDEGAAYRWAIKNKTGRAPEYVGAVIQPKSIVYRFHGVEMTAKQISEKSGRTYQNVWQRITRVNAKPLDDVTLAVDEKKRRGRPAKTTEA